MIRSRADIRLGRFVTIGQQWRRRVDGSVWAVRQVHRRDCLVELEHHWATPLATGVMRELVAVKDLRHDFKWIASTQRGDA